MSYVPLWCKSNFSFLEGASHPEELVEKARALHLPAIAITDRNGVYGAVRAYRAAKEQEFPLITGSEITIREVLSKDNCHETTVVFLAENRDGYANLCHLISAAHVRGRKQDCHASWAEVIKFSRGLIALWGGDIRALAWAKNDLPTFTAFREAFHNSLFVMLTRHFEASEIEHEIDLRDWAKRFALPTVFAVETLYHDERRRPLQDVLTSIRLRKKVDALGICSTSNHHHALLSNHLFLKRFSDDHLSLGRTLQIAERCQFSFSQIRYRYPSERLPSGKTTHEWLCELTWQGAQGRYPEGIPQDVATQLDKELQLIDRLDYGGYFLTMRQVVDFCHDNNILCQGRGSAANSAVCFCLGITAVDPIRMKLLFERFISEERAEPPDIDLDIEHERREEVIQYIYSSYGRTHAAMVANVVRYRAKSSIRDVGFALDIPLSDVERLSKQLSHWDSLDDGSAAHAGFDISKGRAALFFELAQELQDFPRHLSIHPGGFLLGHEAIATLVPIEQASMEGRTIIQWDKDDVETLGLFKVDLLALGSLTHLHRSLDLIGKHRGRELTLATIPANDKATFEMICRADTVGVFQIESRAQMSMLPRLRPENYYDIVVQVSIVRPGPITGGMVHPYLRRRRGEEEVTYPHDMLKPVLEKTLGVPLFQEQVMKLAMVAADYTAGEADQLRRDMAAWRRTGSLQKHHDRLVSRMMQKGIEQEFAERVFKQISGFGEYGFPESHAASFALLSYAGAFIRCHYLPEFVCGLLNSLPMGFYSCATIIEDAKRYGVEIWPIDINASSLECTLHPLPHNRHGLALRMGLRFVKGISANTLEKIAEERQKSAFSTIRDVEYRTGCNRGEWQSLIRAGAMESLEPKRRQSLWQSLDHNQPTALPVDSETPADFATLSLPELVSWDFASKSHSTVAHPLKTIRELLTKQNLPDAQTLNRLPHGKAVRYAGLVICRQRPGTASGVTFMTLEDETGFVNVVVWTKVFEQFRTVLRTQNFLGITGKLQAQEGVVHLIAEQAWQPTLSSVPTGSRDFH